MPASYRGAFIFGDAVKMVTVMNPRRTQLNTYPALDGVEELDLGTNGRVTLVSGRLAANSPALLGAYMGIWESYNDGIAGPLIDTEGTVWPSVKLESFEPGQGSARLGENYGYTRTYVARFRHQI